MIEFEGYKELPRHLQQEVDGALDNAALLKFFNAPPELVTASKGMERAIAAGTYGISAVALDPRYMIAEQGRDVMGGVQVGPKIDVGPVTKTRLCPFAENAIKMGTPRNRTLSLLHKTILADSDLPPDYITERSPLDFIPRRNTLRGVTHRVLLSTIAR